MEGELVWWDLQIQEQEQNGKSRASPSANSIIAEGIPSK